MENMIATTNKSKNSSKNRTLFFANDEYGNQTVFWDENNVLITTIHENDGSWREEYMNVLFEHFDIKVKRGKIPKSIQDQLGDDD